MKIVYTSVVGILLFFNSVAQVKYVSQNGAGTKDGSSWANAWGQNEFANNIYTVATGTKIWMAKGSYKPVKDVNGATLTSDMNFMASFAVPNGVSLYGGFAGTENTIQERDPTLIHSTNKTNINGDINTVGFHGDNVNTLLVYKNAGNGEVIDGLSFSDVLSDGVIITLAANVSTAPVISNCIFSDVYPFANYGALYLSGNASTLNAVPQVNNCFFYYNFSQSIGAMSVSACKPQFNNCIFNTCMTSQFGAIANCIYFRGAAGTINNCTFANNHAQWENPPALSLENLTDSLYINNSIFWDNNSNGIVSNILIASGANKVSVKRSLFQDQDGGTVPALMRNCINTDPGFVNNTNIIGADNIWGTADDGNNLSAASTCVDRGMNEFIASNINTDLAGKSRVKGCRVDMGAYEYQSSSSAAPGLYNGTMQTCTQYTVQSNATLYMDTVSCHAMSTILPAGANAVSGPVHVCVTNNATVPVINGIPYVQRHYDIEPLNNAANATARITIYFTQQDFNNYNAVATTFPRLPIGPADNVGISHIMIEQDHGTSLTSVPGSYSGSTVLIDPDDNNITWNAATANWEVSFDVTGFSGFFMKSMQLLPVSILNFSAKENNGIVNLNWKTVNEINAGHFNIQKSNNGKDFSIIGNVAASGITNGSFYNFDDKQPYDGQNFYRLESVDVNGTKQLSNTISINNVHAANTTMTIAPNPVHVQAAINISGDLKGIASIKMYDLNGRKVMDIYSGKLNCRFFSINIDGSKIETGIYIVELKIGNEVVRRKVVVQ
ncbi:MAG: T9SS type A sorting domain-containing protein [Ferruginibacter sp.]